MQKTIFILILFFHGLNAFSQNDLTLRKLESKRIDSLNIENSNTANSDSVLFLLQGKIADPIICNELGFTLIAGSEMPNYGLKIDYNPLFLKRFIGQIGYRNDFNNSQILNASLESKFLFNKCHYDFRIAYDRFQIENSNLSDYQKLSFGPIYRKLWTSIGCFIGQDSYEEQIGIDFYFKYRLHKLIAASNNDYKSKFELETLIGYWNKEITYDLNLNYLINYNYSCGLGYSKHYDFEEVYLSFRYLLCH